MIEILAAVLFASLLGSLHCVGMCGPFAMLAVADRSRGTQEESGACRPTSVSWSQRLGRMSCYHLGRLGTYLILGAAMGLVGMATDSVADWWGFTNVAARVVGGMMIAMGLMRLISVLRQSERGVTHSRFWAGWNRVLLGVKKRLVFQSPYASAFSWGLISTWLPCGWLYVFAIAAAGAGGVRPAMMLMTAFWIGTLPLLSAVSIGTALLGAKIQRWVQPVAACLLILFGLLTLTQRTNIDFTSSHAIGAMKSGVHGKTADGAGGLTLEQIQSLSEEPLPCCEKCKAKAEANNTKDE